MTATPPGPRSAATIAAASPPVDAATTDAIPSASLLKGKDVVTIEHNGRLYQLRKTKQGKLILTK